MKRRCVVCDENPAPPDDGGFPICARCHEKWRTSGSVDAMTFAARRARRFERARQKRGK